VRRFTDQTQLLQHARPSDLPAGRNQLTPAWRWKTRWCWQGHLPAHTGIIVVRDFQATHTVEINRQELQQCHQPADQCHSGHALDLAASLLLRTRVTRWKTRCPCVVMRV
jgi:hypothetical protein